jgi:hypothetical protein
MLITANQPFGAWDSVFPDKAMTVAAIDRLVHHAVIFELDVESYRRKAAVARSPAARQPKPPPEAQAIDAPRHSCRKPLIRIVAQQWAAAGERPNFALPVLIENCKLPTLFAQIKRCELFGLGEEEARTRLADYLK